MSEPTFPLNFVAGVYGDSNNWPILKLDKNGNILCVATVPAPSGAGTGTVTSVALQGDGSVIAVSGSPITTNGTLSLSLSNKNANTILAGPTSGSPGTPAFRSIVSADIPTLNQNTTGQAGTVATINGLIAAGSNVTISGSGTSVSPYTISSSGGGGGGVTSFNTRTGAVTLSSSDVTTALTYNPAQPVNAVSHQWINSINSSGVPQLSQPAFSDISGTIATGQVPTLNQNTTGQAGTVATINGLIAAGSNITLTGSGTSGSPYTINGTAGGVTSFNTRTGAVTLTSSDVTTALGFTPGTATSVGLSLPNIFTVTGTPVTTSGTLTATLANESANAFFAGPSSGGATTPTFRAIVAADIPTLNQNTTGQAGTVATINGLIAAGTNVTLTGSGTSASPYTIAASGSGGGSNDRLSTLQSAAISVTGATTATLSRYHICTGTSYTVTLPSASTAGSFIGFRMGELANLTGLVTLDAGAGVTIDGKTTGLTGAITSTATSFSVTSAAGFPTSGNYNIQVGSEIMTVTGGQGTTTWTVTRGVAGTTAAPHIGSSPVDWNRTRVMWASEVAELVSDGSNWSKVAGKTIPMFCTMADTGSDSVPNGTSTKLALNVINVDNTGLMGSTSNNQINVLRPGNYIIHGTITYAGSSNNGSIFAGVPINGSGGLGTGLYSANGFGISPICSGVLQCSTGDFLTLNAYQVTGATMSLYASNNTTLSVLESPAW